MTELSVVRLAVPGDVGAQAALTLQAELALAVSEKRDGFVLLSGGTTARLMYRAISSAHRRSTELFRHAHYFMGDERAVPSLSDDSNAGVAIREFLDPIGVPPGRRHLIDGGADDLESEAQLMTSEMLLTVPHDGAGRPVFDLVFLGVGGDGHTASLFPGTAALRDRTPRYRANEVPQHETTRLTVTYPVLNAARHVVVLCVGSSKAAVVSAALAATRCETPYPIMLVRPTRLTWLLDEAAASLLPAAF